MLLRKRRVKLHPKRIACIAVVLQAIQSDFPEHESSETVGLHLPPSNC